MNSAHWTTDFLNQLHNADCFIVPAHLHSHAAGAEGHPIDTTALWQIDSKHWQSVAQYALEQQLRWVAGWAEHAETHFIVNACFEKAGMYCREPLLTLPNPNCPHKPTFSRPQIAVNVIPRIYSASISRIIPTIGVGRGIKPGLNTTIPYARISPYRESLKPSRRPT